MRGKQDRRIKGVYRDVLTGGGNLIDDFGWKSNTIVEDYGRFLAALMKKEFPQPLGVEYMAVGNSGGGHTAAGFRNAVADRFNKLNTGDHSPPPPAAPWAWVKKISPGDIRFLDGDNEVNTVTNTLKIEVTIEENEPSQETFDFFQFALLGIHQKPDNTFDMNTLYFINYVAHGQITKDQTMALDRTVKLTFPIN